MEYVPAILLSVIFAFILMRPFTVFFHELGHAISVMILTKKGATIYVGSYKEKKDSFNIKLGGLDMWFRYNPIGWGGGLCVPESKTISVNKQIVYIFFGPFFSLLITVFFCYLTFFYDLHGAIKLFCVIAVGSALLDMYINLIPRVINARNGILHTDGYLLIKFFKIKRSPKEYAYAVELYNKKEYLKAAELFQSLIKYSIQREDIYRLAISAFLLSKKFSVANGLLEEMERKYSLNYEDYYNWGLSYLHLNMDEKIVEYFEKSLKLNPSNTLTLNGYGYYLNKKQKFREAMVYFEKAIEIDSSNSYAFNNRGHAKIELNEMEDGLKDIEHSLTLEKCNSYAYRNMGIYHLKKKENKQALDYFKIAKKVDKTTDMIDELIQAAKS